MECLKGEKETSMFRKTNKRRFVFAKGDKSK
jgi:hypothetical protein